MCMWVYLFCISMMKIRVNALTADRMADTKSVNKGKEREPYEVCRKKSAK